MGKNAQAVVRFVVRNSVTGRHGGAWRVWVNKSDIYLAPSKDAGKYKISLHDSGYYVGFTAEHWRSGEAPRNAPGPGKQTKFWPRSTVVGGIEHAFHIQFQPDALLEDEPIRPDITEIELRSLHENAIVNVWICSSEVGARPKHPLEPSPLQLADGRIAWVGYDLVPVDRDPAFDDRNFVTAVALFVEREDPSHPAGLRICPADIA